MINTYGEYKDSQVPWIGSIPIHWDVLRGKWLFGTKRQINTNGAWVNVLSLTLRGVVNNDPENPEGLVPKDYATYQFFEKDNLVFKLIDLENYQTSRVGLVHEDGIMSPAYVRVFAKSKNAIKYFYYYYFTLYQQGVYNKLGAGVRSTLNATDLLEVPIPVPSLDEQLKIISFLDYKLADIDYYIAEKEHLIDLLCEQKTAIINQAVTRGINLQAKKENSGIEWLGKIPKHWEFHRLKFFSTFVTSGSRGWADYYSDEGFAFLRIGNISTEYIDLKLDSIQRVTPPKSAEGERTRVAPNDLLISITALIGAVGVVPLNFEEAYVNQHTALVRLRQEKVVPRWVAYCLQSSIGQKQFNVLINGGTKDGLRLDDVKNLIFLLPPKDEQLQIVNFCDQVSQCTKEAINKTLDEIELLNEYRKTLIAEAVTGKIDVRN